MKPLLFFSWPPQSPHLSHLTRWRRTDRHASLLHWCGRTGCCVTPDQPGWTCWFWYLERRRFRAFTWVAAISKNKFTFLSYRNIYTQCYILAHINTQTHTDADTHINTKNIKRFILSLFLSEHTLAHSLYIASYLCMLLFFYQSFLYWISVSTVSNSSGFVGHHKF